MPSSFDATQIPALRVPFIDPRTGLISREWYRFLFNLYNLTGSGSNATSLTDVQLGPPDSAIATEQAELARQIQALNLAPDANSSELLDLFDKIQALDLAPANTPQNPDMRYGVFSDTTTQTAAVINTAYAVTLNTTDLSDGIYIGSPTSRVYVDRLGLYNFQFSAQLDKAGGGSKNVWIWADINGTTQANTGTKVTLAGNNAAVVAAWNFVFRMNAGDYFRLMWSTDDTACQISAAAAVAPVPAIPSVILTVTDNIGITR